MATNPEHISQAHFDSLFQNTTVPSNPVSAAFLRMITCAAELEFPNMRYPDAEDGSPVPASVVAERKKLARRKLAAAEKHLALVTRRWNAQQAKKEK